MRLLPRSLFGRLLGVSVLSTIMALAFAAFSIGHVLERFVIRGLDQQLDAQAQMLARAVRADGTLEQSRIVNLPAFEAAGEGWGWRVESSAGRWTGGDAIAPPPVFAPPPEPASSRYEEARREPPRPHPGDAAAASGERVHFRQLSIPTNLGSAFVTVSGPRRVALAPLREAMVPLLASLALLGAALALATDKNSELFSYSFDRLTRAVDALPRIRWCCASRTRPSWITRANRPQAWGP